jgi:hypothetical protein
MLSLRLFIPQIMLEELLQKIKFVLECKNEAQAERILEQFIFDQEEKSKQKCIEFSKYIRNGKDHFNNGYSTEMVYDEWVKIN